MTPTQSSQAAAQEEDESAAQACIVALKPCCGTIVFAAVNKPNVVDAVMRDEIGQLAALGYRIETWTVGRVRVGPWKRCRCNL